MVVFKFGEIIMPQVPFYDVLYDYKWQISD